jgi:programmed cell death protein 4
VTSKLSLTKYKRIIEHHVSEFFISGDFEDLLVNVHSLGCLEYGYELVKRGINMSFDKGDRERELISKFLCYAHPDLLSTSMIGRGFERLFEIIEEIEKDAPGAKDMLAKFLARCVLDEVLSPSFLNDAIVCNLGGEVVDHTKRMLSQEHIGAKIESCWGPGDGRPVSELKIATDQLVQEYLLSGDLIEATKCIQELQAPQFYHEVVKRAVVSSLDHHPDKQLAISKLLKYLHEQGYLKASQARLGFNHLHAILDDLTLDTPAAKQLVDSFTQRAIEDGILAKDYAAVSSVLGKGKAMATGDVAQ